jgi:hypothetical protein
VKAFRFLLLISAFAVTCSTCWAGTVPLLQNASSCLSYFANVDGSPSGWIGTQQPICAEHGISLSADTSGPFGQAVVGILNSFGSSPSADVQASANAWCWEAQWNSYCTTAAASASASTMTA